MLLEDKIKEILKQNERYIVGHGGALEFLRYEPAEGKVVIRLSGACEHCSLSQITVKFGLERLLKQTLTEIKQVVCE